MTGSISHHAFYTASLDSHTPEAYSALMFTVVETLVFQKQWPLYWSEEERGEFAAYIAEFPNSGDVVPKSGGIRKVRWRRPGTGKSGGVRVIYFTRIAEEEVVLLLIYAKSETDNITGAKLKEIRRVIEN
jgi:hypothetical protein